MQSYKVQPGHTLILGVFVYREGDVLPDWSADRDGGLASRLAIGCLAPTSDRVNVSVAAPTAKTAGDPTPAIIEACETLRVENAEYAESNRALGGRNVELEAENGRLVKALGSATATIEHLKAACEDHQKGHDKTKAEKDKLAKELAVAQKELAELKALDAATAPKKADPAPGDAKK